MNTELIRRWLKLPDGPWPPDHYTLLGLPRGEGDTTTIETAALERMEQLRPYQLLHDQAVTEGMNRLAQAMVCLTDVNARREYDRSLGLPVSENEPPPEPEPTPEDEAPIVLEIVEEEEPVVLELVGEGEQPDLGTTAEPSDEVPLSLDDDEEFTGEQLAEELPSIDEERRELRRELYAELVRVRRVLRAWERLRPFLADPEQRVSRRLDSAELTEALVELRGLLPSIGEELGEPGKPGHRVALLARQQLFLHTFRALLPSQRLALAEDWQAGRMELHRQARVLREEIRRLIVRRWSHRTLVPLGRALVRSPEWTLYLAGSLALIIAVARSW